MLFFNNFIKSGLKWGLLKTYMLFCCIILSNATI